MIRLFGFLVLFSFGAMSLRAQDIIITEGASVGSLRIGQSFEEAVKILGFAGDLKTYDDYLGEELFNEDPSVALECVLGFDYYIKYTHLLTLPVSCVFFKDNVLTQIMVTSFPEYYFAIAEDSQTKKGLDFWSDRDMIKKLYGNPAFENTYDGMILDAYFYFDQGITFDLRDGIYRAAHLYRAPDAKLIEQFKSEF